MLNQPFLNNIGGTTRMEALLRLDSQLVDLFGEKASWSLVYKILDLLAENKFGIVIDCLKTATDVSVFCVRMFLMPETAENFVPVDIALAIHDDSHALSEMKSRC